ncbi:MAG: 16S rRNA (cytidine(1402)-2'-O)-methyltransferase [Lachnospiraceae bacterium]|jgi:16S rRNA (cytidine1402-2'-O)-methyltransferase|nr:16S rRNA (cytidine(1402)-2'-O)-methyltransferase [Lachnospiraceae bacterium]
MSGNLYIVATPIGNLEDITLRAIRILKEVDLIAAEDTRHTLKLLNHLNISKPLVSYYKEIEKTKSNLLIKELLSGKNVALVSDAGTPAISDPGEELVKNAIKNNIKVFPIPGASALICALVSSGISTKAFEFIGFLPVNKKQKEEKLNEYKNNTNTLIFYEAPHKLNQTLTDIYNVLGDRFICLAREITKIHEEYIRGNISELIEKLDEPKGEFVIIVEGANKTKKEAKVEELNELKLEEHYKYYEEMGYDKKEIIKLIAKDRNVNKNEIYKKFI